MMRKLTIDKRVETIINPKVLEDCDQVEVESTKVVERYKRFNLASSDSSFFKLSIDQFESILEDDDQIDQIEEE
jgi:hypothetical protein